MTVADLYENPTVRALAAHARRDGRADGRAPTGESARPRRRPRSARSSSPSRCALLSGLRWVTWVLAGSNLGRRRCSAWTTCPRSRGGGCSLGWVLLVSAPGRMALSAAGARFLLRQVEPGRLPARRSHPPAALAGRAARRRARCRQPRRAPPGCRRTRGCSVPRSGKQVDLHSIPPVTGMLTLGSGCSIEPEVDLSGHWLDGDVLHIGRIKVGAGARVGTRSTLVPGRGRRSRRRGRARVGRGRHGRRSGEYWTGSPAEPVGPHPRPVVARAARRTSRVWVVAYAARRDADLAAPDRWPSLAGLAVAAARAARHRPRSAAQPWCCWRFLPLSALVGLVVLAALVAVLGAAARASGWHPGAYPIHSRRAWQAWATMRVLDEARTWLFPLYSSALTPVWLRLLGARVGRRRRGLDGAADPEADQHQRRGVPGRRHPDRQLRARRRLAARRAHQDRQARLRRQLRHDRARPQGAQAVPGRRAVGGAAAQEGQGRARPGWAARRCCCAGRSASGDDSRTYAPPRRLRIARGLVECCRLLAGDGLARCWPAACVLVLEWLLDSSLPWLVARPGRARADGRRRAGGRRHLGGRSGSSSASIRDHRAPALELVRVAQRAGRHLRRGGGGALVRAGRARAPSRSTCGCGRSAPRSAAASGARPTGCPSPTSSSCATASPSTRAAWCRPTCSTTGC